jgi:hypothetical protein
MKPLKIQLLIFLLIACLSSISAQDKPEIIDSIPSFFTPCDTIYFKNGISKLVKMGIKEKGYLQYYECDEDRNHVDDVLRLVEENDVNYVKEGQQQIKYFDVLRIRTKLYLETALTLGLGGLVSTGFQFKNGTGLGVTYFNRSLFSNKNQRQTLSLDYRTDIGRNVLSIQFGKVLKATYSPTYECDTITLDKSKIPFIVGFSARHYTTQSFFYGFNLHFLKTSVTSHCSKRLDNGGGSTPYKYETSEKASLPISLFIGINFNKKLKKVRRD